LVPVSLCLRLRIFGNSHPLGTYLVATVLNISAQACATAEFGSLFPGKVAHPPWLT
jgi:hypothetical protein